MSEEAGMAGEYAVPEEIRSMKPRGKLFTRLGVAVDATPNRKP